jgi:hypothetical protein
MLSRLVRLANKNRIVTVLVLFGCLGFIGSGAALYIHHNGEEQTSDSKVGETKTAAVNDVEVAGNNNSSSGNTEVKTPTPSSSSKPTTIPPASKVVPYTPSGQKCTDTQVIPYKTHLAKGAYPTAGGIDGATFTCTYTDGRPPYVKLIPAQDKTIYINVTSADYTTAANICYSYPEYFDECMLIVHVP